MPRERGTADPPLNRRAREVGHARVLPIAAHAEGESQLVVEIREVGVELDRLADLFHRLGIEPPTDVVASQDLVLFGRHAHGDPPWTHVTPPPQFRLE